MKEKNEYTRIKPKICEEKLKIYENNIEKKLQEKRSTFYKNNISLWGKNVLQKIVFYINRKIVDVL